MTLSICIPIVNKNIKKSYIIDVFNSYNFGIIKIVDLIMLGKNKRAFIHYSHWNNNEKSLYIKQLLENGKDFKIMYDMPLFWKCVKLYNN